MTTNVQDLTVTANPDGTATAVVTLSGGRVFVFQLQPPGEIGG